MSDLRATLRLQLHRGFTLDHARELVDYFETLGVSHLYLSPLLAATPGSMHGYDGVDPRRVDPELGGEAALVRLAEAARKRGLGIIADIVPNHLAVGGRDNPWWQDLLRHGRQSRYAGYFDVDWEVDDPLLHGKLLAPFLGASRLEALTAGELVLAFDAGEFHFDYFEHRFPVDPLHFDAILVHGDGDPMRALAAFDGTDEGGRERLEALLDRQHYRLTHWRSAVDEINWRRFFDITSLGGLRVEREEVFEAVHAKIFELIERGLIDGLRVDHIDGLRDPKGYCQRLRQRLDRLRPGERLPIYVEKILGHGERLHLDWGVDGTTGYEFMNEVSALQHLPEGEGVMTALWRAFSRRPGFEQELVDARRLILESHLASEFERAARSLLEVARSEPGQRETPLGRIRRTLRELIVGFAVYRTYADIDGRPLEDQVHFEHARAFAAERLDPPERTLLETFERWLGGEAPGEFAEPKRGLRLAAIARFQQLTSPVAAKALEDTAGYRFAAALARNDVGFEPDVFSLDVDAFHAAQLRRAQRFPRSMLTTATHDHKRGEDLRARLAVLSERAEEYAECVSRWVEQSGSIRDDPKVPNRGDELVLYQIIVGAWPPALGNEDESGMREFAERICSWHCKALREAKLASHWLFPDEAYEAGCRQFINALLLEARGASVRAEIEALVAELAPVGALNSLAQTLVKYVAPGVPDLYQGTEFWDFSLVDPDNRRPIDFERRRQALKRVQPLDHYLDHWFGGELKQQLINAALGLRRESPRLFIEGEYVPLVVGGAQSERLLAFSRIDAARAVVVVVPLHVQALIGERRIDRPLVPARCWEDSWILLPQGFEGWCDALSGTTFEASARHQEEGRLAVSSLLATSPVALLVGDAIGVG